ERGETNRLFSNDMARTRVYEDSFNETRARVHSMIAEGRATVYTERGKRDLDDIERGLASWMPAHEEFSRAIQARQGKKALDIRDHRIADVAKDVSKSAGDFKELQKKLLADRVDSG